MDLKELLKQELIQSYAPKTKIKVACALKTSEGILVGHNVETDTFVHAEEMALNHITELSTIQVYEVHLAGSGQRKIKHISPCSSCYEKLLQVVSDETSLLLYEPGELLYIVKFTFDEVKEAYSRFPYSRILGESKDDIAKELSAKTPLLVKDISFIADLAILGRRENISFILTGSASGRSRLSPLIHKQLGTSYKDIDLCVVTDNKLRVTRLFENIVRKHFPNYLHRELSDHIDLYTGEDTVRYFDGDIEKITLTPGATIDDALRNKEYLHKNWFHVLS